MTSNAGSSEDRYHVFAAAILRLSMARTVGEVGDIVRGVARQLTGADGATFILRENSECYYADEDAIGPLWKGKRFPMTACISGWVMLNRAHAVIPDIYQDERIPHEAYRPTFVKSLVMVPIRKDDPLGAIGNYWSSHRTADQQTLKVLQALADIAAVSIESINVYNELERRVQERTMQLEHANDQLKKANNELQTITYALSHDLKAPLRGIKISIERMLSEVDDGTAKKVEPYTGKMLNKVVNTQHIIDELLALFQTGNKDLVMEPVDMKQLANEAASDLKESASENVTITIDELPPVVGDRVLLKHVWSNLISNSIKYSGDKEHPRIRIGFQELDKSVVYCVEDNGVGFDMENADKLFKPFTRLHSPARFDGAGIGLSIVGGIVSRHHGKVWAKSEVDKGTTIFFELPK
jgi:signal transduction histidine kinase